ncbi:Tim10/DDP family zinc finger-domain-containing protein [Zopfochytrium polystomum]|nr:Tim10/DDP family zinc finger-domain-containing protein [Zopfochytrium polystomum]
MDQIKDRIRSELALANYQDLLQRINTKCFTKCLAKPGTALTASEETCIAKCAGMYIETWNLVSSTYLKRAQRESNSRNGL